jgi:isopenicillin N synthase-like dioxygenase
MTIEVPVIDVGDFGHDNWLQAFDDACCHWGCFQVVNHGMDDSLVQSTLLQMADFFDLPRSEKLELERTEANAWGFFDRELTKNVRDWKEIFDYGPAVHDGPMSGSRPQWPQLLPQFQPRMEAFYAACEGIATKLLAGMSVNLGMPGGHLAGCFGAEQTSFLRLNYYPRCTAPDEHLGISQHTDAGALTVLLQDDQAGLQFEHDGSWYTVQPRPGALVINIGDIVQVWSNDRYTAPLHRVLANAERERYSAPFFYNPSYQTDYAPLPGVVSVDCPAAYKSINWGEFRAGRAAGDYANYGEEIQISQFRTKSSS